MSMTDPDSRLPHARAQRDPRCARDRRDPRVQTEERARADPRRAGLHRLLSVVAGARRRPGELIQIRLKYTEDRRSAISGLRRVSRPGRRTYVDAKHIPKVLGGMGTSIVSTSHGVMTGHDARAAGVGGEVLAQVW